MMKPYFPRSSSGDIKPVAMAASVGSVVPAVEEESDEKAGNSPDSCVMQGRLKSSETLRNLHKLLGHLTWGLLNHFASGFIKFPGKSVLSWSQR